ncbi:MAG: acetylornithine/succinylornithine family transaminase [Candidatus Promineifilaceae bacterium]|nr:acetylornithine/succinylornithine family transaminase [Candidatus Promineifilaceae bacterium]
MMNIIELERQFTSGVYGKRAMAIVRGQGARLWDDQGNEYIDCAAGIGVANVGHSHPRVVAAVAKQAATLITCPELVYNDRRAELLARLAALLPGQLNRLFLCNSGTEAVEAAVKFARLSTGRTGVVAAMRGFHGRTLGALSATHGKAYRDAFEPLVPDFHHVPFGKIEVLVQVVDENSAAVVVEVVQGEGGVRPADAGWLKAVEEMCRRRGALLIVDEVQTGYGRTGEMFAVEHFGIAADLLCLGKAMAGGLPMGAVAIGPRVQELPVGAHGSTFGGNPLACAAALAVLDIFTEEKLVARAAEQGAYLQERLRALNLPVIREVRGLGMMVGIELRTRVMPAVLRLMEHGVVALNAGPTTLRLLPPLVISKGELDQAVAAIATVLAEETVGR